MFFDGNMAPPSSNAEMQANWSEYTDWQCYMLIRDIKAAETSQQLAVQSKLLDKVLSSLLELQLDISAVLFASPVEEGEYHPLNLLVEAIEVEAFLDNLEGRLPLPHSEILPRMR